MKLENALKWGFAKIGPLQNQEVHDAALRFRNNVSRTHLALIIIPWLVGKATLYQDAATKVNLCATPEELKDPDFESKAQKKIHAIADLTEKECFADEKRGYEMDEHAYATIKFLLNWYWLPQNNGGRNELLLGFDAVFQSAIIGAWSAIEIVIEDLYGAATVALTGKHAEERTSQSRMVEKVQSMRGMNPMESKKIERWSGALKNFKALFGARIAYSCWFHTDFDDIDAAFCSLDLDALALLRNLFVHSAAIPDPKFLDQGKGIPNLQKWLNPAPSEIFLNGEDVRTVIDAAFKPTAALITAVDKWITLKLRLTAI